MVPLCKYCPFYQKIKPPREAGGDRDPLDEIAEIAVRGAVRELGLHGEEGAPIDKDHKIHLVSGARPKAAQLGPAALDILKPVDEPQEVDGNHILEAALPSRKTFPYNARCRKSPTFTTL